MAVVELLLPPTPAHVRTARLVTVAAARRAGLADELVDEFRLAVGEACARAVGLHTLHAPDERVSVSVSDDVTGLAVAVRDCGPAAGPEVADVAGGLLAGGSADGGNGPSADGPAASDAVDPDVALALLQGLVDDVDVTHGDGGTTVTLRWPLPPRLVTGTPTTDVSTP
jgi:anti-sigma regulatory factor (Ser/Thr protein kinase)